MRSIAPLVAYVACGVLAGCGGGGGSGSGSSQAGTWDGSYTEYSSSHCVTVTIGRDGTFSGLAEDGTDTIYPISGHSTDSGFSFTANGSSYSGTFATTSADGSIDGNMTLTLPGTMPPVSGPLHLVPFTDSPYQGSWSGSWSDNAARAGTLALTVAASGAVSGSMTLSSPALSSRVAGASGSTCFTFTYDFGGGASGFIYGKGVSIDPVSQRLVGSFANTDGASGHFSLGRQ